MIPLITHTPRLIVMAVSRASLTAELHKPHQFPRLLGAEIALTWPPAGYDQAAQHDILEKLTEGGRHAAGWYGWYAMRKPTADTPRTLVGLGSFLGPPDAAGTAEIRFSIVADWRGQGLGTELVAGLVQQAEATGMVRRLLAQVPADAEAAARVLLANGFAEIEPTDDAARRFARAVVPAAPAAGSEVTH